MSGRFRLDPRAPPPERPWMPDPAAPPASAPDPAAAPPSPRPPPAPSPRPPPKRARRIDRRLLVLGAVALALLLVGGGVAVYVATALGYPDKYLLEPREMPSGMRNAPLTAEEREEFGISSNPGRIDRTKLNDEFETSDGTEPSDGYAQVLSSSSGGRVAILALKYPAEDDARSAAADMRALCTFANGAVMRDGDVLVVVLPEDAVSRSAVRAVAGALREKTSDLRSVCGG